MARILLVLRRVHGGIVGNADHHSGIDAGIGKRKERVRRHIQANVFHSTSTANAAERGAESNLHGNLFVGRPFAVQIVIFGKKFGNLGGRGAGIGRNQPDAALVKSARDSLVPDE